MTEQRSKLELQARDPKMELQGGTIFRGADGSVYFIRDQLLDACRLSGEELELAERSLAAAKRAPVIEGPDAIRFEREMPPLDFRNIQVDERTGAASTVMCCW